MREIKFRAWHKHEKRMMDVEDLWATMITEKRDDGSYWYPRNEVVLMQDTGLRDRHAQDIYEGDICQSSMGFRFVVIWDEDNARFLGQGIGKWREHISYVSKVPVVEVIGNIYENSELLGESQ